MKFITNDQQYLALEALTDEESGRNTVHSWKQSSRSKIESTITARRCKLEDMSEMIEKCESSMRKYETRKDVEGEHLKLTGEHQRCAFQVRAKDSPSIPMCSAFAGARKDTWQPIAGAKQE